MKMKNQTIEWVGTCAVWGTPVKPDKPKFAVPLIEETVLKVAFNPKYKHLTRLSKRCAINCTSRLAQRVALSHTTLNPPWGTWNFNHDNVVVKAPASCANNGVRFFENTEHMDLLRAYAPQLARIGIVEDQIDGDAYEIDGAVKDGKILFFNTLRQHWNSSRDRINAYEVVDYPLNLRAHSAVAIKALDINNCCFCFEFKNSSTMGWRLIDAHARLGEDKGLPELMIRGDKPLQTVEQWFLR